ncbi:uncharacterized protein tasor2 isoform X2 [Sebastes fasciatus]|uniref:uncharacterized protein tasor2 isoform X2 n=1 Tax=Sebastes fasciatus TaxID=394691 RepID=UPI003D9F0C2D
MESVDGGASSKGVLVPVSETSDVFQNNILAPLKSAYLYEESKQSFRYKSAVLVNNKAQEEKYCAFRAKRREEGYSEEDLKESYGFLLFDDVNKANALGESGVLNGNSTCTTLGDPSNGVYISMYSDCLDLNRWYHGKSGYIAIIRLTKGRVKKVLENYTQNFTAPTVGFDCHVSEQLPSVSAKTSSFLAFERTQYYMYELLNDGSDVTTQSPSAACPFAIVSFSYTDTKATLEAPQEKSEEKKLAGHYLLWRGQLQIGTQFCDVGLRSTAGALIPAELPPVVKIDRAISMLDLRQLLPKAVFETCFSREVFLDGLYCSLCELVSSEAEDTSSLSLLLREIKEKDLALTIQLNDGGFLILLHPSHFLTYDDTGSSATDVLQGMFVFPVSQVIQRDTKSGHRKCAMSSEILQVLPVLSYAEGEVEKAPMDPGEELCEVLTQHMQSYAALINPGLASSPSREVSMFPDQYDVPDAHKHLYSSPEWTNRAWQSFKSYLSKPVSFQLPVSKASEILAAGKEERIEDLDDDVYICLSSPEEAPTNPVNMESEDQLTGQRSPVNVETSVDSCITSTEAQVDSTAVPQNVAPDDLQAGDASKGICKSDRTMLIKTDDMGAKNLLIPSTSDELPAELIVSITSAEQAVTDESLSMINAVSATKHNDFQLSGFPTDKLQMAGVNSLNDETATTKTILDCPEVTNLTKTKQRKLRRGQSKVQKRVSKACIETPNLQIPVEDVNLKSQKEDLAKESSPQLSSPSTVDQRKVGRRKRNFRMPLSKYLNLRSASVGLEEPEEQKTDPGQESLESTVLMDLEAFPLRKKTERWDLKPVISECGRILVPHGSVDIADLKFLKAKLQSRKDERCPEKMLVDTSVNAHGTVEIQQESRTALETAVGETEPTTSKDGGNHLQNVVVSDVNPELSILRSSDDGNGSLTLNRESSEHSSKTDGTATPPSEAVKGKLTDTTSLGKIAAKGEFLLSKLKSVLLRGKRKTDLLGETTADGAQDAEPCLKKGRVDSQTGMLMSNYAITSVQDANVKDVSKMLSVDPLFAYALGLTPKEPPDKVTEGQDTQQRKDSSKTQEQTILDEQPQILHRPPSIFPRRGRIKTLKKHQGISTEYVKKKWWLHFQTPACFASEKLKNKECTRDNSVRKTVKEKITSACSSTDALNLLADLALGASNDQVPPQPDPALGRKPETGLKKCDLTKDVTSAEQESVLHALLRQPAAAARPTQPLESPTPSHLVGGTELVDLVNKEHAYSLPPSSSLLLGLPGTPFQVSPLSGSTRLLHHHHTLYGNGIKTLHPSVGQKDRNDQNCRTPECLKKHMVCRRKFRQTRTFIDQDGSIQVTKQWEENYDFDLDSKFTSDPKDRTIVRALHGPWDFSMQDTSEEVRLIVHMWIGLFYSRSTARFFHDSYPCSEESDSLEMPSAMVPAPAQSDLKANSFAPFPSTTDTADPSISKALDLSKKDNSVLDQGSVVLDLSLRNSNAEIVTSDPQVNRKETSVSSDGKEASETLNTLKSSVELQEAIQCQKETVQSTEIINEVNDVRSASENKKSCTPSQKTGSLEHTKGPSCKGDGTFILVQEAMESVSVQPENDQTASGIGYLLHGCSNEKRDMKDGIENSEATEMSLLQKHGRDSSKSVTDKEVVSNKAASDVVHTVEHDENESKHRESWKVKEKTYQEGNVEPSPKLIHTNDDSTNKESGIFYNGNLLENDKQLSREEPKAISPGKADNVNEDVDDCTVHKGKVMKHEDHFEREDGLEEKDRCVSPVQADSDLSDQPDRENWKVKEKTYQEGNVEPSPKLIHTNDDSTNKESGIFYNGNLLENDKQLSREEPKAISPGKADNVNEDVDDCTVHKGKVMKHEDHFEREDGLEEKDRCVSPVQADSDLSDQPDRENWKVKEKTYQEGNVEPSPKLIHTNDDSTNKESGIFYNGNLLENDKQLSREEPKAISPGKADNVNEDVDDCTVHKGKVMKREDHFEKEDGLEEKDRCVSPVQADSDLSDQPDRENWKVKEKTCQEGKVEPSPKLIHTNEDSTNKESGIFYNGNLLENDKQLSGEEPKAISPGKADNVNEDVDDCTVHKGKVMKHEDHFEKEDGLEEKDCCVSPVQADSDLSDQPDRGNWKVKHEDHFEKEDGLEEKDHCVSPVQADSDLSDQPDRENWKVKEKTCQEGKVGPSPKLIHTNEDSTNKESGIFYNGNLLENDKQLSGEEPKAISPGKADNVNEDVDDCTVHKGKVMKHEDHFEKEDGLEEKDCCVSPVQADSDLSDQPDRGNWKVKHEDHFEKEDGLEEKDRCVSPVQADSDLSDQPVPMMCDGPDSLKKDSITESNPEPPLDEQPPQADNEDDACHDLQLKKLCANGSGLTDEPAILEKCPPAPSEMEHISAETAVGKSSENYICLAAKTELPMSDENNCSLDGSIPQTNGSVETGSPNKVMANFNQTSDYHENLDTKAIEGEQNVDNTTEKEPFHHQSHSPQCEAEVALTKETYLKQIDKTNEGLEKIHNVVVIPFIGIDTSGEDTIQPHVSHSQGKIEEVVQCQEKIPFISETTYPETVQPTEVCSTSQMYNQKAELSAGKISLSHIDASETNQPVASESESDDRCSTPTMDEKPYEYLTCSGPSSTSASAFSGHETSKNLTQKSPSRGSTSMKEEMPHKSTVNKDANLHHLHPDLELRTLRVLQSIDKFLSKSSHTDTSSQMKTAGMKHSLDQTPYPRSKYIPTCLASSHTSSDSKDKKIRNTTPAVVSASTSQELHTESTGHFLISPFKSKLEEVLGVKLQLQKTDSVHQHYFERTDKLQETSVGRDCHSYRSVPSTESLRAIKPNIDQDKLKTTSQTNLSHEPHSYSQRPVMAVKPSKSDENQADYMSKDRQIENTVMSHKIPLITCTIPTTMLLEKKTESLKRTSEGLNDDKQDASELPSKSNWFSNVSASKPNSDQAKFVCLDPLYQHKGRDFSKFNKIPSSSLPLQSFEYAKSSSKRVDGNQGVMTFHEQVGQTTKECIAMDQKDCSDASTSHADFKDGGIIDESLYLGPQSSLMCTVYNTSQKRSYSFLEQVSQRCLQDDPTEASMEKESLIFSEQMKQLLKRTKREHNRQQDTHDKQNLSCASPVTVHFCSLEEQEDSVDHLNAHLDAPSLFGQKIKVDMSDRKYLTDTTEEDKTLHPQKISQGTGNPMEHAGVSGVTSECTRVYEAMMNDVCAVKTVPSRPKHFRMDGVYPKTEPSYHFDFCDEMKKEMESFRSSLNSVVKKSCKTKYRFYILVTSDDAFFEETKAHLEAEGHTAVQPSEFFLGEDSSSSLLIILRNEDIAEHICEVPHLLELKKSPGVHFAGIDEPDDVVNLTHQELFTRGGFIMFDRAALEPLSLCNLKKMSEILQELSRTGKWKWMLHYRDSRRLKENARLSAEAKEKKHFLNWCQETGILEVLPYHECDLMSKDQPDYLSCLARLQVQNISARCPVFITDTTTDSAFGKNGILTTTFESFLTYSPSKTFTA